MLEKIRAAVVARLHAFGVTETESLRETILISQGLYCGRKFECAGFHAVWFVEEDELKLFGASGQLLLATSAVALLEQPAPEALPQIAAQTPSETASPSLPATVALPATGTEPVRRAA
jgi:hypothetical protein